MTEAWREDCSELRFIAEASTGLQFPHLVILNPRTIPSSLENSCCTLSGKCIESVMWQLTSLKSEFNRNVLTLASGATIAQLIPILSSPILTRFYTPNEFGLFSLFVAITAIL